CGWITAPVRWILIGPERCWRTSFRRKPLGKRRRHERPPRATALHPRSSSCYGYGQTQTGRNSKALRPLRVFRRFGGHEMRECLDEKGCTDEEFDTEIEIIAGLKSLAAERAMQALNARCGGAMLTVIRKEVQAARKRNAERAHAIKLDDPEPWD